MTYEASDNTPSLSIWWKTAIVLGSLIIAPVFLPILLVVMAVFLIKSGYAEHKFRKRLRRVGRILHWRAMQQRLEAACGTLILGLDRDDRAWWIPADLKAHHPECPLATARDFPKWSHQETIRGEPAMETWCAQYFPAFGTTACLVTRPIKGWDWMWRRLPEKRVRFVSKTSMLQLVLGDKELWVNRPPGE